MTASLIRVYNWTPHYVDGLFLDGIDHFGINYLYDDLMEDQTESNN